MIFFLVNGMRLCNCKLTGWWQGGCHTSDEDVCLRNHASGNAYGHRNFSLEQLAASAQTEHYFLTFCTAPAESTFAI